MKNVSFLTYAMKRGQISKSAEKSIRETNLCEEWMAVGMQDHSYDHVERYAEDKPREISEPPLRPQTGENSFVGDRNRGRLGGSICDGDGRCTWT
jgi:hypothetical protein